MLGIPLYKGKGGLVGVAQTPTKHQPNTNQTPTKHQPGSNQGEGVSK